MAGHSPAFLYLSLMSASPWIVRHLSALPVPGRALDLACGGGRHARYLLDRGYSVTLIDRDISGVADLAPHPATELLQVDLEDGSPWPLAGMEFDLVVVTNYLHRPIFDKLLECVRPGGVLLYETFAEGNEKYGRPSNPDFLLRPGELRERVQASFDVIAYEQLETSGERPAVIQHIAARKSTN